MVLKHLFVGHAGLPHMNIQAVFSGREIENPESSARWTQDTMFINGVMRAIYRVSDSIYNCYGSGSNLTLTPEASRS